MHLHEIQCKRMHNEILIKCTKTAMKNCIKSRNKKIINSNKGNINALINVMRSNLGNGLKNKGRNNLINNTFGIVSNKNTPLNNSANSKKPIYPAKNIFKK